MAAAAQSRFYRREQRSPKAPHADVEPDATDVQALVAALQMRESQRSFSPVAVDLEDVKGVLAAGRQIRYRLWPSPGPGLGIESYVLARHVSGLKPGMYNERLHFIRELPSFHQLENMSTPSELMRAPCVLLEFGRLIEMSEHHGPHGYRQLLLGAGATGHASWIEAMRRGLVGCLFGVAPRATNQLIEDNDVLIRQLLGLALGHRKSSNRFETPTV